MDYPGDKELVVRLQPESWGGWFYFQMEAGDEWCSPGFCLVTGTLQQLCYRMVSFFQPLLCDTSLSSQSTRIYTLMFLIFFYHFHTNVCLKKKKLTYFHKFFNCEILILTFCNIKSNGLKTVFKLFASIDLFLSLIRMLSCSSQVFTSVISLHLFIHSLFVSSFR